MVGIVTLPMSLYHYLCDTSFERAMKLPADHHERKEFDAKMRELESAFRSTEWESDIGI